jgi:hypothetical protein
MGGTALSGPVGQEQRTCLPDAAMVCLKHQGAGATTSEARGYMPEASDTSMYDIMPFVSTHGFAIKSLGDGFLCNEQKALNLMSGHYIVMLTLTGPDGSKDKHACALTEVDREMFIVDNMARQPT